MARRLITGVFLAGLAGFGALAAARAADNDGPFSREHEHGQHEQGHWGGMHGRWNALSPEDRAAFTDARIAALRAGMKLTPDQEKLWPPVEAAIRDLAKLREKRREAWRERREHHDGPPDAPTALRNMADAATARGEALRKLADATGPLYATLDEGQKRRAAILVRPMRPHFGHGGWRRHHMDDEGEGR